MFECKKGTFVGLSEQRTVDELREWCLTHFVNELRERPSLHRYINTLPPSIISKIDILRHSDVIKNKICAQFGGKCNIIPLDETDELYISHVNKDKGGDQGLFDKHYDGTLRFLKGSTVVRSLIYLSSSGKLKVVFSDCGATHSFKTYEFGLLDFHREYHWVEGEYDANDIPRILLKCNYMLCEGCSKMHINMVRAINVIIFFIVKYSMEYSKSPKTLLQCAIGFFCNFFREVNNISPILSMFVGVLIIIFLICFLVGAGRAVLNLFQGIFTKRTRRSITKRQFLVSKKGTRI